MVTGYGSATTLRHTAAWLTRHGRTPDSWWGVLDYSGPCQPDVDRDCDGWWDHGKPAADIHDNCVFVANPDQLDTNNDGTGDVCQQCAFDPNNDEDDDGICATVSTFNTLYKTDNCPRVRNGSKNSTIGQQNCNEEAEQVRRRANASLEILGDACDPVPCPQAAARGRVASTRTR